VVVAGTGLAVERLSWKWMAFLVPPDRPLRLQQLPGPRRISHKIAPHRRWAYHIASKTLVTPWEAVNARSIIYGSAQSAGSSLSGTSYTAE